MFDKWYYNMTFINLLPVVRRTYSHARSYRVDSLLYGRLSSVNRFCSAAPYLIVPSCAAIPKCFGEKSNYRLIITKINGDQYFSLIDFPQISIGRVVLFDIRSTGVRAGDNFTRKRQISIFFKWN